MSYPAAVGRALASFIRREGSIRDGGALEFKCPPLDEPMIAWPAREPVRAVYQLAKGDTVSRIAPRLSHPQWRGRDFPRAATFFHYGRLMRPAYVDIIASHARDAKVPIYWVADLDPGALAQWYVATRGGWAGITSDRTNVSIAWRGVTSDMMDLVEPSARRIRGMVTLSMSALEREVWAWLRARRIDWERVIGRRAIALLDDGRAQDLSIMTDPRSVGATGARRALAYLLEPARG